MANVNAPNYGPLAIGSWEADEKSSPVNADTVLIKDSADGNKIKEAQLGNLPGGGGGSGDVTGPASSTDNAITRFNGTGGKTIQNSGVTIDDSNNIAGAVGVTATSFTIGANTLNTTEFANLDGQDQAVKTTDSPTFGSLTVTNDVTQNGNRVLDSDSVDNLSIEVDSTTGGNELRIKGLTQTVQTLSDGANVTVNFANGPDGTLSVAGDRTIDAPSNGYAGLRGVLTITVDGTDRTLTWAAGWKLLGGATQTTFFASSVNLVEYYTPDGISYYLTVKPGY